MRLSNEEQNLHNHAIKVGQVRGRNDVDIIEIVRRVFVTKLHKKLELSLYEYTMKTFNLDEPNAYGFNAVAKKSLEIPLLFSAIKEQSL